jgi:hypothetical protein
MRQFKRRGKLLAGAILAATLVSGCGDSDNFVFTNSVPINPGGPVVEAPVARNDTFNALGNATLNQAAGGVLANDTPNGATITGFDAVGSAGGAIALNEDGSFTYTPLFGFTGSESFSYTLSNQIGKSTATVTLNVPNLGFFVNNQAAPGGDGSQASPFDTLAAGLNAAAAGDTVFVFRGDGTPYNGGFILPDGVNLIGQGNGLIVAQQIEPAGQAPEIGGITLAGNNTVSGFLFTGSTDAITASDVSNLTITNNTFQTSDNEQVGLKNIGGTLTVSDNIFELEDFDDGLELDQDGTDAAVVVTGNTVRHLVGGDQNGGHGLSLEFFGDSAVTANISDNVVTGSGSPDNSMNIGYGIFVDVQDTASLDLTMNNNTISAVANEGVYVEVYNDASLSANGTGNSLSNIPVRDAFYLGIDTPQAVTVSFSDLTVSQVGDDTGDHGFELDIYGGPADVTASVSGSSFSSTAGDGIHVRSNDELFLTLTDNNLSATGGAGVEIEGSSNSSTCLDVTGNTFDGENLSLNASNNAVIDVEQLDVLDQPAVNSFINGAMLVANTSGTGVINNRPDGFCTNP